MEGSRAYYTYIGVKLHFTTSYDFFKYGGKTRQISDAKLQTRKDYHHFRKLERRYKDELLNFMVSNIVTRQVKWGGDLVTLEAEQTYTAWKKHMQAFKYFLREDLLKLSDYDIIQLFEVTDGQHPKMLTEYMGGNISLETLVACNEVLNFIPKWNNEIQDQIIWPDISKKIMKYRPFLTLNKQDIKAIMREVLI